VRWRFLPSRLLAGRVAFAVEARLGTLRAEAQVSRTPLTWRVDDLRGGGDASALATVLPLAAAWQPAGTLAIEAATLTWDGKKATGAATVEWRDAALALSAARPLGSWRAQASAEGSAAKVTLATTKGPLRLSGNGTLALPGRLAFSGEARAEPGRERDLEGVLALLGPRRADGAHALELR
jgi:general secretion pathway protein N